MANKKLGAEVADVEVDPRLLAHGRRRDVGLAPRAPRVAPGDEHVQEAPGARRGHHPAAAGGRVAVVALLHAAAAPLHGGRGHGRRRRGGARAAVLLLLLGVVVVRMGGLLLPAALEPLQGRLHLLDGAHAAVRRRGAGAGAARGGWRWRWRRRRRRRQGAGLRRRRDREQVEVHRRWRARVLLLRHPPGHGAIPGGRVPGVAGGGAPAEKVPCDELRRPPTVGSPRHEPQRLGRHLPSRF
uniref:Uncharacterized protein n=1 Tax=Zea mays TaxID=4577 RepID=C0P9D1_MAIZE|nr:unknown [Zea mays]